MKVYRIRKGDLYSKGGMEPRFTKKGKLWTGKNYLKNHFNLIKERFNWYKYRGGEHLIEEHFQAELERIYGGAIVIEMDFETGETKEFTIKEFLSN